MNDFFTQLKTAAELPSQKVDSRDIRRYAAVSLIFHHFKDENDIKLGMIRRAIDARDPWSGQMAFPGGGQDPEDNDLQATSVRETFEEVGIHLAEHASFLGSLDEIHSRRNGKLIPLAIAPFIYHLHDLQNLRLDTEEVHSFHWFSLSHFLQSSHHIDYPLTYDSNEFFLPAIQNSPVPIWGISYLMLKNLFDRFDDLIGLDELSRLFAGNVYEKWRGYPPNL